MLSSAFDKAKLLAKNFSKNSNLDDSGISVSIFRSGTNLKLHNISVTPKMVKKVILNLDSSNAPGPDVVPVVVLKNCEPEGHILKSILRFRTKFALAGYFGSNKNKWIYVKCCAICYHLYNLKNVENTHGGGLLLLKVGAEASNFTKSNTPPWVFFTFLNLYKWYQIAQRITYNRIHHICNYLFYLLKFHLKQAILIF